MADGGRVAGGRVGRVCSAVREETRQSGFLDIYALGAAGAVGGLPGGAYYPQVAGLDG